MRVPDHCSPYKLPDSRPLNDAAEHALLVNASESLGSASVMLGNVIGTVEGPARKTLQGIAQVLMLGELAVNQALDNVVPVD